MSLGDLASAFNLLEDSVLPVKKARLALLLFTSPSRLIQARHNELIMDTVITTAKNLSLYTDEVDWPQLVKEITAKSENAETLDDLAPSLELLIKISGRWSHHP